MKSKLFLFLLLLFSSSALTQEYKRQVQELCSPQFHGRGYVFGGDSIASEFIANEFEKLGVLPLCDSYFQTFNFPVNTFPNKMFIQQGHQTFTPGEDFIIDPSSRSLKGNFQTITIPNEYTFDIHYIKTGMMKARNQENPGILIFDETKLTKDTIPYFQALVKEVASIVPVIVLSNKKFVWSVSQKANIYPLIYLRDSLFQSNQHIKIEIDAKFIPQHTARNVIAFLPAKKKTQKTIVFTAHYDHLGRMGKDTYFPGANDNASGTSMLFTLAKHFKQNPSEYNILFIAFAGEEAGLIGSKFFTEHPLFKLKKIKFLVNLDIMGSGEDGITELYFLKNLNCYKKSIMKKSC